MHIVPNQTLTEFGVNDANSIGRGIQLDFTLQQSVIY